VNLDDTIVAVATPAGRGGIGVVRLTGPEARAIAAPMLRLKHELEPGRAVFGELVEPAQPVWDRATRPVIRREAASTFNSGEKIDEVVVLFFQKPHSYTTDDIVEISAHGSPVVLRHIVELALERGARLAEPGEFTMRAFLNGRIDLTQAEAVRDLIESQTLYQAKVAAQQLEGSLANRLRPIKELLVNVIATMEAGVDFAEDDVSVMPGEQILERIAQVRQPLEALAATFGYGKVVHEGLTLAIVGRPNVGKSSLFNRLVERERAIVTATPGTTRDLVTETVAIGGIPVRLVDTAGIRAASDEAESIGVQKTMEAIAEADVLLVVADVSATALHDPSQPPEPAPVSSPDDDQIRELLNQRSSHRIIVLNKIDLNRKPLGIAAPADIPSEHIRYAPTSALTGEGVDALRSKILEIIGNGAGQHEFGFLTNARHQGLVRESLKSLDAAAEAVRNKMPHEMILLDLYGALRQLDEITGATTADDILNRIFSSFCIGK
jgi:tRNA modification GTPase